MRQSIQFFLCLVIILYNVSAASADGVKNEGFILNQGQWPDSVWSRGSFSFGDVIVKKDGIQFFLRDKNMSHHHGGKNDHSESQVVRAHVYNMKFKNATFRQPLGLEASDFKIHYLKGNDPTKWVKHLACHKKLLLENIYRNIDLLLYLTDEGLKYDLILKDKANADDIIITYEGVDSLVIDEEGRLQIKTSLGTITEHIPIAYVEKNNQSREAVSCKYVLKDRTVRFDMKHISRARQEKLVIDPKLIFSTYSGSSADNWGNTATYDSTGAAYIAGVAFDNGFPTTVGAFQIHFNSVHGASHATSTSPNGDPDVAIMKFDATGKMVYATYLGGGITESPTSTITNDRGELYILGTTGSRGITSGDGVAFPTTAGAYSRTFKGGTAVYPLGIVDFIYHPYGTDLFVSQLSADGSTLLSSTLVGGSGNDGLLQNNEILSRNYGDEFRSEILLDSLGFVYVASHTQSNDIINLSKPGYDHSFHAGGRDGIVMKLKPDLTDIVWNTYWGGNGLDACYSLQFGINNDLYISGGTTSTDLPVSSNAIKPSYSGNVDGFILRLSSDGTSLLGATYIGTSSVDQCQLVQTDKQGNVYVLGQTQGAYPVVNAPYFNRSATQFIHKLNNTLSSTLFSTTIGSGRGKTDFVPTAFLVNDCGKILLAGWGGDLNHSESDGRQTYGIYYQGGDTDGLPITSNAFQKTTDGSDFYLMLLEKDVQSLLYATYFGGTNVPEHVDGGTSRFDKRGIVYESVCACTFEISDNTKPNYPVTSGAHSSTINSYDCNNALFKFDLNSLQASFNVDATSVCGTTRPLTFTNTSSGGATFVWNLGDGTTISSSGSFTHLYKAPGTYTAKLIISDPITCKGIDSAEKIIHVYALPTGQFTADSIIICKGDTTQLNAAYNADYTYTWTPNQYLSNNTINDPLAFPPATQVYTVSISDQVTQCQSKDSISVIVVKANPDTYYQNITGCQGQPKILVRNATDKLGFQFLWDFGDGSTSTDAQQTTHTYKDFGTYTVSVLVYNASCSATDTMHVTLTPVKIPNLFTPNGDGHNDQYVVEGMTDNWRLDVFNRWGDMIYTRQPYDQSWNGDGLSGGVYYFLITDSSGNKCKGWVELFK